MITPKRLNVSVQVQTINTPVNLGAQIDKGRRQEEEWKHTEVEISAVSLQDFHPNHISQKVCMLILLFECWDHTAEFSFLRIFVCVITSCWISSTRSVYLVQLCELSFPSFFFFKKPPDFQTACIFLQSTRCSWHAGCLMAFLGVPCSFFFRHLCIERELLFCVFAPLSIGFCDRPC